MDVRMPDGTLIRGVPDGTTKEQLLAKLQANGVGMQSAPAAAPEPQGLVDGFLGELKDEVTGLPGRVGNLVAGAVRGAGSIGATVLAPVDMAMDAAAGKGLSLESNRQRRADMDAGLQSLGADPNSTQFQVGKVGTEIVGTLPIGGVVGRAVGAVAPRLGQAIASGGLSTGARVAPGAGNALADAGIRAAGGAINGAVTAGAVNPDDAPTGTALGTALPAVTKLAGTAGQIVGSAVSQKMARSQTVNKIASELGADAPQVVADIQTYYPRGAENIPVSAAAATKNPALAQMEQGSRLRSTPEWHGFDVNQSRAAYGNVQLATKEADDLASRMADRRENWQQAWDTAAANMKPRLWRQRMTQFGADMRQAEMSPESSNPNVRAVLDAVNAEMDRVGPNFTPSHLQQLRANLNGKGQPMSPDAFKSAPRDNPAIISLKQEMDDILNTVTGGKWQKVIDGYAQDSQGVHAAKAAQRVRNGYTDAETGRIVSPVIAADIPHVTAGNLNRSMNAARLPDKSLALSPDADQRLSATLDALRRQEMVKEVKRSASAGGGSDTVSNAITSGVAQQAGAPSLVAQMVSGLRQIGMGRRDAAMADLLSHPDELAAALQRWLQPVTPNRAASLAYRAAPAIAADQ
jgi:hypothetical protein